VFNVFNSRIKVEAVKVRNNLGRRNKERWKKGMVWMVSRTIGWIYFE